MSTSGVPLDPDLFNPEIVGTSFRIQDSSGFYPTGDDDGWDSDPNNFDTDDDEPYHPPRSSRFTNSVKRKSSRATTRRTAGDQGLEDQDDEEEDDDDDGDSSGEDDGSGHESDSSDLHRLIGAIHNRQVNHENFTHGVLAEDWDRNMEQELNELREAEEALKPRMRRSKIRGEPELSVEVSVLLGKANLCFIEKDYDQAIPLFEEIVRIEPMCKMAWNNLGAIYQEMGNFERSSQFRIIAAHLSVKPADLWKELASESRQHGLLSQAIYCYSEAIKAGKNDVESMWDRSYLLFEIGRPRQALAGYLAILKISPHNPGVLREVAHLCATTGENQQPIKLFKEAFKHYQSVMPSPSEHWLQTNGFGMEHILILVRLLMKSRSPTTPTGANPTMSIDEEEEAHQHYHEILKFIKQAARWLQGRLDPNQDDFLDWDLLEDDREFDPVRRTREDWESLDDPRHECAPTYPLDTQLRAYLGICRLMIADEEEALFHFNLIKRPGAYENHETGDICMSIGDAYSQLNQWDEALEFYHDLAENDSTNKPILWHKIGRCYRNLGNLEGALECFEAISETDPLDLNARIQLTELYEQLGHRQKALDMVNEVIELRRKARESGIGIENDPSSTQGLTNGTNKLSNASTSRANNASKTLAEKRLDEELLTSKYVKTFEKLELLSSKLSSTKYSNDSFLMNEYARLAHPLIEGFRQTPALFPCILSAKFGGLNTSASQSSKRTENNSEEIAQSDNTSQEFRGIQFSNWVRIFVYYAFSCAKMNRADEGCEVLGHVMRAPTFRQSASMQQVLRLAYAGCCFAKEDYVGVVDTIRWLARILVFHNDPIRLITALLSQGFQASIVFFNTNTQKWLLRQLQLIDAYVDWMPTFPENSSAPGVNNDNEEDENERDGEEEEQDHSDELGTNAQSTRTKKGNTQDKKKGKGVMMDQTELLRDQDDVEDEDYSYWKPSKFKPTKINPVFIATFAEILSGTRSFKSAIVYFLRLHEFYPDEPLLNLLLAIGYVQRAMQRQTDNRHHQIVQGLAFFDNYRELRGKEFNQEVEFNLGRLYHGLGLISLAVTHYNRVLALAPTSTSSNNNHQHHHDETSSKETYNQDDETDLSNLAAYNLILIYSTAGSPDLAHQLSHQYFTV